ncbi:MAG: MmcQ/YjbR family DNA-binding protein [Bacteroidota bacterium]|nr:MmcQ/YjbR family DNA-binding protein [Bacteroidota bacterium]
MTIEDLQTLCNQFCGVTEDIKLGSHLCFNVGGKTFLFTSPDEVPVSAAVKVPAEDFEEIISKEGFSAQKYVARYKWVQIDDISRLTRQEWEFYLEQSYRLIAEKLPAKVKKEIGL